MIGSPLFTRAALTVADGRRFTVIAANNAPQNPYIQSATLNGRPLTIPVIRYEDIVAGATLRLVMGPSPSRWASDWTPAPLLAGAEQKVR
jgi:putative alpha-1,2-mannosidase